MKKRKLKPKKSSEKPSTQPPRSTSKKQSQPSRSADPSQEKPALVLQLPPLTQSEQQPRVRKIARGERGGVGGGGVSGNEPYNATKPLHVSHSDNCTKFITSFRYMYMYIVNVYM